MDDARRALFRSRLTTRLDELQAQLSGGESLSDSVALDQARVGRLSRMDALQQQAMLDAARVRAEQEIRRVQIALRRLETEDFGCCTQCDEPIAEARLMFDPAVSLCFGCADK